jgi:tetratricopeptide (TPR) repeat protein
MQFRAPAPCLYKVRDAQAPALAVKPNLTGCGGFNLPQPDKLEHSKFWMVQTKPMTEVEPIDDTQALLAELDQWAAQSRRPVEWEYALQKVNDFLAERNPQLLVECPSLLNLYARALFACGHDAQLERLIGPIPIQENTALAHLLYAGSLVYAGQLEVGCLKLKTGLAVTNNNKSPWAEEIVGLSWRYLARAQFSLGQPWRESLEQAKHHLKNRQLGLAWDQHGHHLEADGNPLEALNAFTQALRLLEDDPHASSVALCNLAIITLNNFLPGANRYVQRALQLTGTHPEAKPLRAVALRARATLERSRGELERASSTYQTAWALAKEKKDKPEQAQAIWGIAHTLRLQSRCTEALEWYMKTEDDPPAHANWVWADRAACLLELGDRTHAEVALGQLKHPPGLTAHRAAVLRAELARRDGNLEVALELLRPVPTQSLAAREEVSRWPELFALAGTAGLALPKPIVQIAQTRVGVRALGVLNVRVNGRRASIPARGKLGELLVFLLESDDDTRTRTTDEIRDAFYPHLTDASDERKAFRANLYDLEHRLRGALGWEGSVLHGDGVVELDPNTDWRYDVQTLREKGEQRAKVRFLEGVYSDWVSETEQALQAKFELDPSETDAEGAKNAF